MKQIYTIVFITLILHACNVEKKIAEEYIKAHESTSVLILKPEYLFKSNIREKDNERFKFLDKNLRDSLLLTESAFLKDVSDSIFITNYIDTLMTELTLSGIRVYTSNNIDSFMCVDSPAYIFTIAQMEIEEDLVPVIENEFFDSLLYSQAFELNTVTVNTWFEVTKLNDMQNEMKVLFSSQLVSDYLKGRFRKNLLLDEVKYKYTRNNITLKDVYELGASSGKTNANYIIDYIMNEYIYKQFDGQKKPKKYYTYDRKSGKIKPAYKNRFIFL